jgi:hypothetical protein
MKISPYLEDLLKSWGNEARRIKPWYTESPYLKEFIGKTARTQGINVQMDDSEKIGLCIGAMAEPLRRSLEAMYKHKLGTDFARAKWCRCSKQDYKASFWEAIRKLEDFVSVEMAI